MKKQNQKGFTLAELLIVVAIIAVLVALAIPVFTKRLEASRETTDLANLRSAYAAGTVAALAGDVTSGTKEYKPDAADGLATATGGTSLGKGTTTQGGVDKKGLPSVISYASNADVQNKHIEITFAGGKVTKVAFK